LIAERLRDALQWLRIQTHCGGGSFKSQFKKADRSGAHYALVIGEDEVVRGEAGIKPLRDRSEQQSVAFTDLAGYFAQIFSDNTTRRLSDGR